MKLTPVFGFVAITAFAGTSDADAHSIVRYPGATIDPAPPFVRSLRPGLRPAPRVRVTAADRARARAGGWAQVTAPAPFRKGATQMLLMTDGTVMVQDYCTTNWWSLAPDQYGNYVNGTWTQKASLPANYAPLFYSSAVLADGKLIVIGGEYNFCGGSETNHSAIYDPVRNFWTPVLYRSGEVGDAPSAVLFDGTFMIGPWRYTFQSFLHESTLTFSRNGPINGKADENNEEGWTLLPNGKVLAVDVTDRQNSEIYDPTTKMWSFAGLVPLDVAEYFEMGPQVLRPDGTVFAIGASKNTAVYDANIGKWEAGPTNPIIDGQQLGAIDAPATLLRDGSVMYPLSANIATSQSYFFKFDGKTVVQLPGPPNAPNDYAFMYTTLILPTGQVLVTDESNDVEIYTPRARPMKSIAPVISSVATSLVHGHTYQIAGRRFNGFSQANMYGDDAQLATNYPLVRITNDATGHVFYARTHDHSSMAVASNALVSTYVDIPAGIELGTAKLEVVANGIASKPVAITVN